MEKQKFIFSVVVSGVRFYRSSNLREPTVINDETFIRWSVNPDKADLLDFSQCKFLADFIFSNDIENVSEVTIELYEK